MLGEREIKDMIPIRNDFNRIEKEELRPFLNMNVNKLEVCVAPYNHTNKPKGLEIIRVQRSFKKERIPLRVNEVFDETGYFMGYTEELINYRQTSLSIYQLMWCILNGRSYLTGYTTDGSTNSDWLSSHMLGIDIDNGLTIEEALKRCEKYSIYPTVVYPTFSYHEKVDDKGQLIDKYRMIFIFDEPVRKIGIQKIFISMIMSIFPECDSACKNICRLWHGTNKGWFIIHGNLGELHNRVINVQNLLEAFYMHVDRTKGKKNRNKFFRDFCQTHYLRYKGSRPYIEMLPDGKTIKPYWTDEEKANSVKSITTKITSRGKERVVYEKGEQVKREPKDKQFIKRNVNFEAIAEKCYLFGKARDGEYWLYEPELVHLIKNLQGCSDGKQELKNIINNYPHFYNNAVHDQQYYLDKIDVIEYRIEGITHCKNYCPFYKTEHCQCVGETIMQNVDKTVPIIDRSFVLNKVTLEQGQTNFKEAFVSAIEAEEDGVYVIKSSMGQGKTQELASMDNWIERIPTKNITASVPKIVIAEPTHVMRGELGSRLCENLSEVLNTQVIQVLPKPPVESICDDEDQIKRYKAYMRMGAYELCSTIHNDMIDKAMKDGNVECINYLNNKELVMQKHIRAVVTTHDKVLVTSQFNDANLVIFDEDPTQRLLKTGETTIEDVERLRDWMISIKGHVERSTYKGQVFGDYPESEELAKLKKNIKDLEYVINNIKHIRDILLTGEKEKQLVDVPIVMEHIIDIDISKLGIITSSQVKLPTTDVLGFLKCHNYIVYSDGRIAYINIRKLFKDRKYIILSGTADEDVCKLLFGEQLVKFYDCGIVENQATVYQNIGRSFNKGFLKTNIQDVINNTFELNPILERERTVVITHSSYKHAVEHAHVYIDEHGREVEHEEQVKVLDGMWYGATEGKGGFYDTVIENGLPRKRKQGEAPYFNTLMLVGKFVAPREVYKMWIVALGIDDKELDGSRYVEVTRYGITNQISTFQNEQSRAIHLWLMESELRQALGRARQIRTEQKDVRIIVYTDLVLPETDVIVYGDMPVRGECCYDLDVV